MGHWLSSLLVGDREVLKVTKEEPKTPNYRMRMFYSKGGVLSPRFVGNKTQGTVQQKERL